MKATTILGLDFGERRIGVALSDTGKTLASGLTTLDCRQNPNYLTALGDIIREEDVEAIVVGYPLRTDGKTVAGGKTEAVDAFIVKLEAKFGLPVHREDESFTSQMASQSLKARGRKKRGRRDHGRDKAEIDRVAACYILQDFLDHRQAAF
ncbi:MAG: Holliday junction resolvase RuvX [Fibrobacterota bacterium]|nr:Holliday junction resolvase RuvX [Fibrobacterota bacterium]